MSYQQQTHSSKSGETIHNVQQQQQQEIRRSSITNQSDHHVTSADNVRENQEDLDLEDTIENVFEGFDFERIRREQGKDSTIENTIEDVFSRKPTEGEQSYHQRSEDTHDHMDLDDAIGNALSDVFGTTKKHEQTKKEDEEESSSGLHHAIGDTLGDIMSKPQEAEHQLEPQPQAVIVNQQDNEMELDDVIGEAFNNVFEKSQESQAKQEVPEGDFGPEIKKLEDDQMDLDDAIGDAFANVFNKGVEEPQPHETAIASEDIESSETKKPAADANVQSNKLTDDKRESAEAPGDKEEIQKRKETNDEHDLETAIEDALGDVLHKSNKEVNSEQQKQVDTEQQKLQEDDLDAAIGDAFGNILDQDKSEPSHVEEKDEAEKQDEAKEQVEAEKQDDLDAAIGGAFANVLSKKDQSSSNVHKKDDLEDAISDAFSNISKKSNESVPQDEVHSEPPSIESETLDEKKTEVDNVQKVEPEEDNLEDAIGDAFDNIFANQTSDKVDTKIEQHQEKTEDITQRISSTTKVSQTSTKEQPIQSSQAEQRNDDLDLDNAIGDAFKSIIPQSEKPESKKDTELEDAIGDAFSNIFNKNDKTEDTAVTSQNKNDDTDLDSAIGDAFKSILPSKPDAVPQTQDDDLSTAIGDAFKSIQQKHENEVNDDDLNEMISASFKQILGGKTEKQSVPTGDTPLGDNDMKDVITEAFKSAMSTTSKKKEKSKPSKKDKSLVQNIVNQFDSKNSKLSESAIHNLAVQISHQVQDHLMDDKKNVNIPLVFGLPQLDESVLEHFQNEAYAEKEESSKPLQAVINNALKNVEDSGVADLESLQMNDILQNAFKMALEKPQELISDLEIDDTGVLVPPPIQPVSKPPQPKPKAKPKKQLGKPASKPSPIDIPVRRSIIEAPKLPEVSVSEASKRLEEIKAQRLKKTKEAEEGKKLSIAESLALSRTMLNQPRRDYSSIESIEQILRPERTPIASSLVSTPLSNVLNSLTSKISRGEVSDTNIMSVIRSMTETLSAGGKLNLSQYLRPPTVEDIISKYRDDEKKGIVNVLNVARKYLVSTDDNDKDKAVSLIDKAVEKFNIKKSKVDEELSGNQEEFISSISNSVINTIISSSPKDKFTEATLAKIEKLKDNNPPEFDQKVRIDNRERKKKWREENAERNKDNDLRVRVIKKANKLFGEHDSEKKTEYIERTFSLRRERRLARSKKEDSGGEEDDERRLNIKTKDAFVVSRDPTLVKPVSDIYNIFKGVSNDNGSLEMLMATGASVAAAATLYSQNNDTTFKSVDSAISSILTYLLNSKTGIDTRTSSLGFPSSVIDRSSLVGSLSNLNLEQKRESSLLLGGDFKRTKLSDDETFKSPGPTPFWGATSLKMPHYKKKDDDEQRTLKLPRDSPFISNKVHLGVGSSSTPGLRKPGSFQKPAIVKSEDKSRTTSLGFPKLYSASYS